MLNIFRRGGLAFEPQADLADWRPAADAIWIDLVEPSREEELAVEAALGVQLPTVAEMQALEPSSRLYQENGATVMTATLLSRTDDIMPLATPVTFAMCKGVLITVRYVELRAFSVYSERARDAAAGGEALLGLLDAVIERLAQGLDGLGDRTATASGLIFRQPASRDFKALLTELAQVQAVTSLIRTSLVSLARLTSFANLAGELASEAERRAHLASVQQDVQSLTEHCGYLSTHVAFLLDAALGLINIEQSGIIKFFSVVAVVFMPPTLIASIYGMNFDVIPELHWKMGYPLALTLMAAAAILPILWFKRRGWF